MRPIVNTSCIVGLSALLLSSMAGCSAATADESTAASQDEIVTCEKKHSIQDTWEGLLLDSKAQEITREQLPAKAITAFDSAWGSDLVAYKANVGKMPTFAFTYWPNDTDEILGKVVVFYPSGSVAASGYWKDSPQIYWEGSCN